MNKVERIISLIENGRHKEALTLYKEILNTGSDEEKFTLAEDLFQFGFLEEVKGLLENLLETYPDEGELLVMLAEVHIELGDEEKAILLLEKISEEDSSYPESLLLLADLYQMNGLYEVSEQKLLKAKRILPDEVVIDFALGELYAEEGKLNEAIKAYEAVLQSETEIAGVNIHRRIAEMLSSSGAFEEALPFYEKAMDEKLEIDALFGYAFTALQAGFNKTAIEKFLELKELDPEYHSLYLYLAKAYEREGELESGLKTVKEGIKYDEFNKDLFFYGGKLALKLGDEEEAEKFLREALSLDPGFIEAALTLNKLLLKQNRYEDVLEIARSLEAQGEEEPQIIWDEAVALQHLEDYSQALNKYELAYTFFKNHPDFLSDYGYFLLEEGKRAKAVEIFSELAKNDPTNDEYLDILERLQDEF
ncbi:tetratricopeptide repeat protein [Bacillus methanolicus]|uniref:TPR repeat-containing protein YpiA n=1 Tax=Bacillus methanolicus (strain MGA3 / ATCC 53907) TaxID=796606 RepID=I3E9X3_BACMM|nr:tetratricopeptide repeat protein [Bacillus methanolicus]AIE60538.1 TPR repeat-containing protein YpiA [Bacillus methanolicus MGA3]EIJ83294.1 TPR-repeat-containing protein [Bacillus methanolicus MGA3]